ncbi:hypothetical protein [Brevibacillus dissolubilis]|uniref:hypothetical protein n=1 Tax=Brevibacillus dissolubilis TaxID=1844116 RepID=UPI001116DCBF|nr:hypothetical protein [Brevibacillus dissolubilis]
MKRTIKVTIHNYDQIKENLNNPDEIQLFEKANGNLYEADIEPDGYAVIEFEGSDDYIELAPDEYQLMITEWKVAGKIGDMVIETMSDPNDDTALLYRGVDGIGNEVQASQSFPKKLVELLNKAWFAVEKKKVVEMDEE